MPIYARCRLCRQVSRLALYKPMLLDDFCKAVKSTNCEHCGAKSAALILINDAAAALHAAERYEKGLVAWDGEGI